MAVNPERSPKMKKVIPTSLLEDAAVIGMSGAIGFSTWYFLGVDLRMSLMYGISAYTTAIGLVFDRAGRGYQPGHLFEIPGQATEPVNEAHINTGRLALSGGLGSALGLALSGRFEGWIAGGAVTPFIVEHARRLIVPPAGRAK